MEFVDFFSGAGGMRMGLERAGHKCVGFCEFDKYARQSYKAIFNTEGEWENHDIRTVESSDIPRADLWTYGFPCQGISVAGKQKGIGKGAADSEADERSNLFYQIIRLLQGLTEEARPEWLLCENVKNLLSIDRGYGFARILCCLDEAGYDSEWQLFNTKYSYFAGGGVIRGIPQNRERVYVISHLRKRGRREVFPIPRADGENIAELQDMTKGQPQFHGVYKAEGGCAPNLETSITKIGRIAVENIPSEPEVKQIGRGMSKDGTPIQGYGVYDMNGVSPTLTTGWGSAQPYVIDEKQMSVRPILTPDREEKRQNGRRMKNEGEPMFTLTAQDRHGVAIYDAYNDSERSDGTVGTITASGGLGLKNCGSFLVIEDETDTDKIHKTN